MHLVRRVLKRVPSLCPLGLCPLALLGRGEFQRTHLRLIRTFPDRYGACWQRPEAWSCSRSSPPQLLIREVWSASSTCNLQRVPGVNLSPKWTVFPASSTQRTCLKLKLRCWSSDLVSAADSCLNHSSSCRWWTPSACGSASPRLEVQEKGAIHTSGKLWIHL